IGLFVNTLVLRADLTASPDFAALLGQVRDALLDAYLHQEIPFERLVEELAPERTLAYSPLFQVMFVFDNTPAPAFELSGLAVSGLAVENVIAKFDLALNLRETPAGLGGSLGYSTDLFDATTVERFTGHFQALLAAVVRDPRTAVAELPLLAAAERQQLLVEWNDTVVAGGDLAPAVHRLFADQAARTPDALAVVCEGAGLTYAELDRRANRLAHQLHALGVGPERLVGVCAERSPAMLVALLGVLKAGGAYVPLDPDHPRERLARIVEEAGMVVLLAQEGLADRLPAPYPATLLLSSEPDPAPSPAYPPAVEVVPESLAYVIYTSGSTGRPKGAMNSHRAVVNRLRWMQSAYGLEASDAVLQKTPFSFDVSVWEFFWPIAVGARLEVAIPGGHQDPDYLSATIARAQITTLHFVPAMLSAFLDARGLQRCRPLRRVIASGEALSAELVAGFYARLPWSELHNLYGPTEAAVDVTSWACRRGAAVRAVPIGRPIANLRIHLLDPALAPVALGIVGELYIAGVGVGRGYVCRPDLTAEKFVPDPYAAEPGARMYRSGDLARRLPDGAIEYLGRTDHQVKIRGLRIELGEIEAVLGQHPGVREAVVLVREDRPGDKRLVGYVTPTAEPGPTPEQLRSFLAERLPGYMVPAAWVLLAELPLTANGKVDRRALPAPQGSGSKEADYLAPRGPVEEVLAAIWEEVLRRERVGVEDDFFALGGHSLLATKVTSRVRRTLGVELPLRVLFESPTIAALALEIERARRRGGRAGTAGTA
ncbi:MAG TPA: amino acid adenylation domain-containing protein, partial [Thermoanaerobaculia bacterium]|nr:amino acid adenylation domain-containing protein [Thermoanaerobaculia bacterium]